MRSGRGRGSLWGLEIVFLCTFLLGPGMAAAAEQVLFGPTAVPRTGPITQYTATIVVPPTLTAPYRLHVQNGDGAGHHTILTGTVTLNGSVVVAPWVRGKVGGARLLRVGGGTLP